MPANNTTYLITAARRRHEFTRAKTIKTLRELDQAGTPITFELIARTAAVSRSWLYTQPDIRTEIQRLRATTRRAPSSPVPDAQRSSDASLLRRLETANQRNRHLTEENQRLRRQLAETLGHLRTTRQPHPSITIPPP